MLIRRNLNLISVQSGTYPHSAAEFLCERKSSIFWRRQKYCGILHRQNSTSNPDKSGSFQRLLEVLKPTILVTASNNENTLQPLTPNRLFTFLPTTKGGKEDRAGNEVVYCHFNELMSVFHASVLLLIMDCFKPLSKSLLTCRLL